MYPENEAKLLKGKLFTFGSYRMGVSFKEADIDTLIVCPKFISRNDFFTEFSKVLSSHHSVEQLQSIPSAFVPIMTMKFAGIEIDMLFVSADFVSIPEDYSLNGNSDSILRNMSAQDVRSINGVRVTDEILNLVYNKQTFRQALKVIRLWAKRRGLYSNSMGFLGGISWAILVARICQLWPMASVSKIVFKFFYMFGLKWQWPVPVTLREKVNSETLGLTQWDPNVNPLDQHHVMPILIPCYPIQNTTHNVCEDHKLFILDQLKKAHKICEQIIRQEKTFEDLFKPLFFFSHKHYLVLAYRNSDEILFRENGSLVESKLRFLIQNLQDNYDIQLAILHVKSFDSIETHESADSKDGKVLVRRWLVGFRVNPDVRRLSLANEIDRFISFVNIDLDISYSSRRNLESFLPAEDIVKLKKKREMSISRKRKLESCPINEYRDGEELSNEFGSRAKHMKSDL